MANALENAVLDAVTLAGETGVAMGTLVDQVIAQGARAEDVELALWALLGQQRVVPSGFICRMVRKRDPAGNPFDLRTYEFLLARTPSDEDRLDASLEDKP